MMMTDRAPLDRQRRRVGARAGGRGHELAPLVRRDEQRRLPRRRDRFGVQDLAWEGDA